MQPSDDEFMCDNHKIIVDQAALMGVLNKLNRLNLTILSLNEVKKKDQEETK